MIKMPYQESDMASCISNTFSSANLQPDHRFKSVAGSDLSESMKGLVFLHIFYQHGLTLSPKLTWGSNTLFLPMLSTIL